jgi:hypothetical protein
MAKKISHDDLNQLLRAINAGPIDDRTVEQCIEDCYKKREMTLDLTGRELTRVPESMAKLTHITGLNLDNNYLTELPLWIKNFRNLTRLEIQDNEFRELPSCIMSLKNLEYLDVSDNKLNRLPKELRRLRKLKRLNISIIGNLPLYIKLISDGEAADDGGFDDFNLGELRYKN